MSKKISLDRISLSMLVFVSTITFLSYDTPTKQNTDKTPKLYLIGGSTIGFDEWSGSNFDDVYSSLDGKTWTEVTDDAEFPARYGHQVVVFKNKLYFISRYEKQNDIWSSSDGVVWK